MLCINMKKIHGTVKYHLTPYDYYTTKKNKITSTGQYASKKEPLSSEGGKNRLVQPTL